MVDFFASLFSTQVQTGTALCTNGSGHYGEEAAKMTKRKSFMDVSTYFKMLLSTRWQRVKTLPETGTLSILRAGYFSNELPKYPNVVLAPLLLPVCFFQLVLKLVLEPRTLNSPTQSPIDWPSTATTESRCEEATVKVKIFIFPKGNWRFLKSVRSSELCLFFHCPVTIPKC